MYITTQLPLYYHSSSQKFKSIKQSPPPNLVTYNIKKRNVQQAAAAMNKYEEEGPKLCAKGCSFFGIPANHDLCSKCYNDYLKQKLTNSAASIVDSEEKLTLNTSSKGTTTTANGITLITANSNNDDDTVKVIKRNRCESCKKRVGLLGFDCSRCGGLYCGTHRYPEEHSCPFDFKKSGRADLAHKNPLCKGEKLGTRA